MQAAQIAQGEAADMPAFAGGIFFGFGQGTALAAIEDDGFAVVGEDGFFPRRGAQGEDSVMF